MWVYISCEFLWKPIEKYMKSYIYRSQRENFLDRPLDRTLGGKLWVSIEIYGNFCMWIPRRISVWNFETMS